MNKTPQEAREFLAELKTASSVVEQSKLVIFPPALLAYEFAQSLRDSSIGWGGQNCHFESVGAFTGENSPMVLKGMGAQYCLVGHSERRQLFGEADLFLSKKVKALQDLNVTPVLCVGETLEERKLGRTKEIIVSQTQNGLRLADKGRPFWLAYEPVWAIGTGQVATLEQVEEAHKILRELVSKNTPILYGGSVKSDNSGALSKLSNVDGFLIGGASLKVSDFLAILRSTN